MRRDFFDTPRLGLLGLLPQDGIGHISELANYDTLALRRDRAGVTPLEEKNQVRSQAIGGQFGQSTCRN
jgi:hypothetical protein